MRKLLFTLASALVLVMVFRASTWAANLRPPSISLTPYPSIEYSLPFPGLLPDHPLYSVKVLRDKILEFFTKDPVKKVHLDLLLSDKRLVMGRLLWDKKEYDLSSTTLSKGEKYLLLASQTLVKLKERQDLPPGLADKLMLASKKHEEVLDKLITETTDSNKINSLKSILSITHQANQQLSTVK